VKLGESWVPFDCIKCFKSCEPQGSIGTCLDWPASCLEVGLITGDFCKVGDLVFSFFSSGDLLYSFFKVGDLLFSFFKVGDLLFSFFKVGDLLFITGDFFTAGDLIEFAIDLLLLEVDLLIVLALTFELTEITDLILFLRVADLGLLLDGALW
jgi:hypothetical protein